VQNDVTQGQKGQQRHIIGNQHGTEEGYVHQRQNGQPEVFRNGHDLFGDAGEEADVPQGAYHSEGAEEAGQGPGIEIGQIFQIRRYDHGGTQREGCGDRQHRVAADKQADLLKNTAEDFLKTMAAGQLYGMMHECALLFRSGKNCSKTSGTHDT